MYKQTVPQFIRMLENLSRWLEKAEKHAETKKFDVNTLSTARLIADQYPLNRQVQSVCDSAKICAARLTGKEWPKHEDNETTFEQLHQRINKCVTYLKTFKPEDFKGSEDRPIALPFFEGKSFPGEYYANHLGLPNFYFHVTTVYAILRANGVDVGKTDYVGALEFTPR